MLELWDVLTFELKNKPFCVFCWAFSLFSSVVYAKPYRYSFCTDNSIIQLPCLLQYNYKEETSYSIGTVGAVDESCDFLDLTYVRHVKCFFGHCSCLFVLTFSSPPPPPHTHTHTLSLCMSTHIVTYPARLMHTFKAIFLYTFANLAMYLLMKMSLVT